MSSILCVFVFRRGLSIHQFNLIFATYNVSLDVVKLYFIWYAKMDLGLALYDVLPTYQHRSVAGVRPFSAYEGDRYHRVCLTNGYAFDSVTDRLARSPVSQLEVCTTS